MKNNTFEEIWNKMKGFRKVIMKLHDGPDGDSLGCCVAMKQVLEKEGVEVILISKDPLSENLSEFEFSKEVEFGKTLEDFDLSDFDSLIMLDHGALTYDKKDNLEIFKKIFIINIDHHDANNFYGQMNYVEPNASSCCSILVNFFKEIGSDFNASLCRKLFLGICTDTGFFKFGDSLDNFRKGSFLIERGKIDYGKEFLEPVTASSWGLKKLQGALLSRMEKVEVGGKVLAYSFATEKDQKDLELNLAEKRLAIICMEDLKGVDFVFVLKEMEDYIKGSFRSKNIDTTYFSKALGGGGHKKASAFNLEKMPLEDAIEKVLNTIKKQGIHEIL